MKDDVSSAKVKESKLPKQFLDTDVASYCEQHCSPESEVLSRLVAFTAESRTDFQVNLSGRSVGQLLQLLVSLSQSKRILDIGTFTGYSALAMAEASVDGAHVTTLDANPLSREFIVPFLEQSVAGHKVSCVTCFAHEWLLQQDGSSFDFIFLDADKHRYPEYLSLCWELLDSGGLLVADNILWGGHVVEEQPSTRAQAVHRFNELACQLPNARVVCLPLRDGVMILQKIGA